VTKSKAQLVREYFTGSEYGVVQHANDWTTRREVTS